MSGSVGSGLDQQMSVSPRRLWIILGTLMLTMLLPALDQTIVATALPTITSDLGGLEQLSWVVTAYLLASTASTPLWGKLSDLYGRKLLLQSAVVVFLVGSALAGLSQSMNQLIATRALQGLGAGGLMVLVLSVIADLVTPRERGKYSGLFGGVFGFASVIGPLLGGLFTQHMSWRWVFYVNLPLGVAAFVILGSVLRIPVRVSKHKIDWIGASLLVAGVVMLLLVTVWGGQQYPWASPTIIGLGAGGVAALLLFVWQELRHPEPIIPLSMFRNPVVRITSGIGFIVGFGMFGAIVYMSMYLQVVRGFSPTDAGLQLLPLLVGLLVTSIVTGRLITRTGRYRIYPVLGTATATVGMFMLSRLGADPPVWYLSASTLVLGVGLGGVLQVLVIAVQNAIDPRQLGSATSVATFSRSVGASFGAAALGAVWTAEVAAQIADARRSLPPSVAAQLQDVSAVTSSMDLIRQLPGPARQAVVDAIAAGADRTFLVASIVMAVSFVLALFLQEIPLRHELVDVQGG